MANDNVIDVAARVVPDPPHAHREEHEFISIAKMLFGFAKGEAGALVGWSTMAWVRFFAYFVGVPLLLVMFDGCAKMYWDMPSVVRWAPYFTPLTLILILGTPLIFGGMSVAIGAGKYLRFVRVLVLWGFVIPIGILLVPVQDCPTAFWMFIPIIAGHELAYWSEWHNAPEDRQFQKIIMGLFKVGIVVCVVLPFLFAAMRVAKEHGYALPKEDTAEVNVRVTRNKSAELIMEERTQCVANITSKVGKDHPMLTMEDEAGIANCNALYQIERLSSADLSGPAKEELSRAITLDRTRREEGQRSCVAEKIKAREAEQLLSQAEVLNITRECASLFPQVQVPSSFASSTTVTTNLAWNDTSTWWPWVSENWAAMAAGVGFITILHVVLGALGIAIIWLLAVFGIKIFKKNKNGATATTTVATTVVAKSEKKSDGLWWWDFLPGWVRIGIFAVIGLFGYTLYAGTGWFYDLLPNQQQVAKVTVRPNQVMDQVEAPHFRAFIRNTDHPYHGQALTVEVIDDRGSYALVVNTPDKTRYLLRNTVQNRPQIYADGVSRTTAGGLWENGVINGTYEASLSAGKRVLTLRSPKLGEDIVMELRRVS